MRPMTSPSSGGDEGSDDKAEPGRKTRFRHHQGRPVGAHPVEDRVVELVEPAEPQCQVEARGREAVDEDDGGHVDIEPRQYRRGRGRAGPARPMMNKVFLTQYRPHAAPLPRRFEKPRRPEEEHHDHRHIGKDDAELRPYEDPEGLGEAEDEGAEKGAPDIAQVRP